MCVAETHTFIAAWSRFTDRREEVDWIQVGGYADVEGVGGGIKEERTCRQEVHSE